MGKFTLIVRFNAGNGKFPSVKVEFSKNHHPIPIQGATYLRARAAEIETQSESVKMSLPQTQL